MRFLDFAAPEAYDSAMMPRALLAIVLVMAGAGWVQAQTLADLARTEAARRKASDAPAKVYTNDDLRPDPNRPVSPPAASAPAADQPLAGQPAASQSAATAPSAPAAPAAEGAPAAGGAVRDQAYWSTRLSEARAKVERSQAFAQALQNRIDMLWTDFVNRGDPVQQRAIEQERNKALAELERLKKEIEDNQKAVAALQDEARREGVPAGWLRP